MAEQLSAIADQFDSLLSIQPEEETEQPDNSVEEQVEPTEKPEDEPVDAAEEASDDSTDEAEEQEQEEQKYLIKVGDEEVEVTLEELQNGYSRQADYTRKTQEVAQQRKQVQELEQQYTQSLNHIQRLAQELQQVPDIPEPDIDWEQLSAEDPIEFLKQKEFARERQAMREQRAQQFNEIQQEQARMQQYHAAQHLEGERQLLMEAIPAWKDSATAKAEKQAIRNFAVQHYGLDDQQLRTTSDHRVVKVLYDAYQFHQANKKANQAINEKTEEPRPVLKRQGRSYKPTGKRVSDAQKRLSKERSMAAAADVFAERFGD